jgi:hypothetical protein
MIKKTLTYTDHNGKEHTEDFHFNLPKGEFMLWEMEAVDAETEGMTDKIERLMRSRDGKEIVAVFKDLIAKSYGIKTADGRFMKEDVDGRPLIVHFRSTEAYDELIYELATDADAGAEFVNGIAPKKVRDEVKKEVAARAQPQDYQKKQASTVQVLPDAVPVTPVEAPVPAPAPVENLEDLSKEDLIARLAQR